MEGLGLIPLLIFEIKIEDGLKHTRADNSGGAV
jgi:hypothetical protein